MSTVTELDLFCRQQRTVQPAPVPPGSDLRVLWSDALAIVPLALTVAIVVWRILIQ